MGVVEGAGWTQLVALWPRIAWTDRVSSRDSYQVGYVEIVVENGKVEVMRVKADEDGRRGRRSPGSDHPWRA